MLQKEFFQVQPFNPYPYWDGYVFFESSTPGSYSITIPHNVKCGLICVGAGGGGSVTHTTGLLNLFRCSGGGSGGYSYKTNEEIIANQTITIVVGSGGSGITGTNINVQAGNGTESKIEVNGIEILVATGGTGGHSTVDGLGDWTAGIGGTGVTLNGNSGQKGGLPASGGSSVYNQYGAGGSAGDFYGQDGGSGYVKIYAIMPS